MKFLVLLVFFFSPLIALAQLPAGALDPDCYFPDENNPDEMQVLVGSPNQTLGIPFQNPGLLNANGYQIPFVQGLPKGSTAFLDAGPQFNLKSPVLKFAGLLTSPYVASIEPINFATEEFPDLLVNDRGGYSIYWADDMGNYDTARRSNVGTSRSGQYSNQIYALYTGKNASGIWDDIICVLGTSWKGGHDTVWVMRYKGGTAYAGQAILVEDSAMFIRADLAINPPKESFLRSFLNADYNGDGKKDILAADTKGNLFFGDSRQDLDMENFLHAITLDTLLARWQNPSMDSSSSMRSILQGAQIHGKVIPKSDGSQAEDLVLGLTDLDGAFGKYGGQIMIFKGGNNFGENRLYLDSAEFYFGGNGGGGISNLDDNSLVGDLTGTGQPVMAGSIYTLTTVYHVLYVLGKALDNKADVTLPGYNIRPANTSRSDSLAASDGVHGSALIGDTEFLYTTDDFPSQARRGKLTYLKGSSKIPVRLNPKYSVRATDQHHADGTVLYNSELSTLLIDPVWPLPLDADFVIYDLLGRGLERRKVQILPGQTVTLTEVRLVPGTYILRLTGGHQEFHQKFLVIH